VRIGFRWVSLCCLANDCTGSSVALPILFTVAALVCLAFLCGSVRILFCYFSFYVYVLGTLIFFGGDVNCLFPSLVQAVSLLSFSFFGSGCIFFHTDPFLSRSLLCPRPRRLTPCPTHLATHAHVFFCFARWSAVCSPNERKEKQIFNRALRMCVAY